MARLTDQEFEAKWNLGFADNTMQDITEKSFRDFKTDLKDSYANLKALNVRQVKGATYPLPYTDSVSQIPAPYRIVGMLALARVGTTAADAATLPKPPGPVTLQLVADAAGDVDALVDEQPATTATVKAKWVPAQAALQLSQSLTLAQAQSIEGTAVVAGISYLIDFGSDAAGHAQVVTLLGTAANLFAIRGQLTVNGVRSNVRVNVASGVFGQEVSNLLDTANAWKERQTFLKGLGLYNGVGFDEYGQLTIGQILLADKFLWRGNVQKMAQDVLLGWSPDDYAGQGHGLDSALGRAAAGVVEVNTGTHGNLGKLRVEDILMPAADPADPDLALTSLLAGKAGLDPDGKLALGQEPGVGFGLLFDPVKKQYAFNDGVLFAVQKTNNARVDAATGQVKTVFGYTTFVFSGVPQGITLKSNDVKILYGAYQDYASGQYKQAWYREPSGNALAASFTSATPVITNGNPLGLIVSVLNADVPNLHIAPQSGYDDAPLKAELAKRVVLVKFIGTANAPQTIYTNYAYYTGTGLYVWKGAQTNVGTIDEANASWEIILKAGAGGGGVESVNGKTGVVVLDIPAAPETFDVYLVAAQKRVDVKAAYSAANKPVEETDERYFGQSFIDDTTVAGTEYEVRCTPGPVGGATVWKWRYYKQGK